MNEEHLAPLIDDVNLITSDCDSSDVDSSVEIVSNVDENENELIRLSTYLHLESSEEENNDQDSEWPAPPSPCNISNSSDIDEYDNSPSASLPTASNNHHHIQAKRIKGTRRSWSVKEKLTAVAAFEKNLSKRKTAKHHGCTTAQLRSWLKNKENLYATLQKKKGNKRKRVEGGGRKLVFVDLDHQLFIWYRTKRSDPKDITLSSGEIKRERITFRHLMKEGRRLAKELSLQKPKRQNKIPIDDVHRLAQSFYTFNRRVSTWSIKRSCMGGFTIEDISNMDETPMALFGDQCKRSINDIGTSNDVNGCISNKRFCTILLTVFAKNQRMEPVVLFKGTGNVGVDERQQYAKGVHVIFTPKAFINGPSMNLYIQKWLEKVHDGQPKLLILDSANSHLETEMIQRLRKKNVVVSIIPKGCTQYLQVLDTSIFSAFKHHYQVAADEFIDKQGCRIKLKLSAKQQRILCTRLIRTAWIRTQETFDFERAFLDVGYI
ncbi:unnamed protein product [Adineta steineri]|uniref:DDE-1 domain-containing protein n=1 Tax=Adineta steineri TaxID=433720 RepID=A0A820BK54_9BILA|nr:unnamed protein product [Adineta steineri]CAF4199975.1 unnamed protein product [Adineta steineri]